MKKLRYVLMIATVVFYGCKSPALDISEIDFNGSVTEQIGSCSAIDQTKMKEGILASNSLYKYYEADNVSSSEVTYTKIPVASTMWLLTHTYEDKFIDFQFSVQRTKTLEFAKALHDKLGKPDKTLNKTEYIEDSLIFNNFKKQFPTHTNWVADSIHKLSYPYMFIWDKPNFVHCYLIEIDFPDKTQNRYVVRNKEAYKNGIFEAIYGKRFKELNKDSPTNIYLK